MKWVRIFIAYVFCVILFLGLINLAFSVSGKATFTHPDKVEQWLNQSGLYTNIQNMVTDQARSAISKDVEGGSSVDSAIVSQAAQAAFPQSVFQQASNEFITSNYAWLSGQSNKPNFSIDLTQSKETFASKIVQLAIIDRINKLPTCTPTQTLNTNPLLLTCKPPNINTAAEAAQIKVQILNSNTYLSNPVITASTINTKGGNGGQLYYVKFSKAPRIYQAVNKLPWIIGLVSFISLLVVIFVSRTKRVGLRRIAIISLVSGLLLVSTKFVSDAFYNRYKDQLFNNLNVGTLQGSIEKFVHSIESELVKINLWFGIGYLIFAVVILLILLFTRTKKPEEVKSKSEDQIKEVPPMPTSKPSRSNPVEYETPPAKPIGTPQLAKPAYKPTKSRTPTKPPKLIQ
jgi:hypothetical protein